MEDDTTLEGLPRMQFHLFIPWQIDDAICDRCGGPTQAHPSPEWLAEHPDEAR